MRVDGAFSEEIVTMKVVALMTTARQNQHLNQRAQGRRASQAFQKTKAPVPARAKMNQMLVMQAAMARKINDGVGEYRLASLTIAIYTGEQMHCVSSRVSADRLVVDFVKSGCDRVDA